MSSLKATILNYQPPETIEIFDAINWIETDGQMALKPTILAEVVRRLETNEKLEGCELYLLPDNRRVLRLGSPSPPTPPTPPTWGTHGSGMGRIGPSLQTPVRFRAPTMQWRSTAAEIGPCYLEAVREFGGQEWTQQADTGPNVESPVMSFDSTTARVLLFDSSTVQTCSWNGAS
jgi:hypothetical protein